MNTYRVYGWMLDGVDSFDEYYDGKNAKDAARQAKKDHPGYYIAEVSKVLSPNTWR